MYVILFLGGYAGDLVTSVIDSQGCAVRPRGTVFMTPDRIFFKTSSNLSSIDKNKEFDNLKLNYKSIPSHDFDYHLSERHNIILVTSKTRRACEIAASRFFVLVTPEMLKEIYNVSTESELADYYETCSHKFEQIDAPKIYLEDILDGRLLEKLSNIVDTPLNEKIYNKWLQYDNNKLNT